MIIYTDYMHRFTFFALIATKFLSDSFGCIGFSQSQFGPPSGTFRTFSSAALARGTPNAHFDGTQKAPKCKRAGFGAYRANEIRRLATFYQFAAASKSVNQDAQLSCVFDPIENCAWHNANDEQRHDLFRTARFDSALFNADKFDCTGERTFPIDGYFLIAGGREQSMQEASAAIEAKVPCQMGKALLKFDYWSINETPVLQICVFPEENLVPQCEESKMDVNPLTFEIPQNLKPFRLRIQVNNIVGRDDIVLLDNIHYDGDICEIESPKMANGEEFEVVDREEGEVEVPKHRHEGAFGGGKEEQQQKYEQLELLDPLKEQIYDDANNENAKMEQQRLAEGKIAKNTDNIRFSSILKTKLSRREPYGPDANSLCEAMECNFNGGEACQYNLQGMGSTTTWRVGNGTVGNPHTGIHKGTPTDPKLVGYAFAGTDSVNAKNGLFVLESPMLRVDQPVILAFDLFQRAVGPQLKVCLNSLDNCPYESPSKPNAVKHWFSEQRVILRRGTEKVYFVGSNLRLNLFIAIDNIRLQTMDFDELCGRDVFA